jgi:hypothetical protein
MRLTTNNDEQHMMPYYSYIVETKYDNSGDKKHATCHHEQQRTKYCRITRTKSHMRLLTTNNKEQNTTVLLVRSRDKTRLTTNTTGINEQTYCHIAILPYYPRTPAKIRVYKLKIRRKRYTHVALLLHLFIRCTPEDSSPPKQRKLRQNGRKHSTSPKMGRRRESLDGQKMSIRVHPCTIFDIFGGIFFFHLLYHVLLCTQKIFLFFLYPT